MGIIFRYLTILFFTISAYSVLATTSVQDGTSKAIEDFAKNHKIQAVYAVADNNKIVVHGAQGFCNLEQNKHLSVNDQMGIASGTKPFTAAAVLLLKDRNLIDLHSPISKYLHAKSGVWRDGKVPDWAHKLTTHHLLSHSSGLPEYVYTFKIDFTKTQDETNQDILHFVGDKPLAFIPGSKFEYNNTGYMLLGMIIEKVSGKTYADFMKQELFEPNDLKNTKIAAYQEALDIQLGKSTNCPTRYYVIPTGTEHPQFVPVGQEIVVAPNADGGGMSTVEDLIKWNAALHGGKILSKDSYKKMTSKYFATKSSGGYNTHAGYGMYISKMKDGTELYHHEGRALGIRSDNGYIAKDGISYAMISNMMMHIPKEMEGKVDLTKPENQLDILYLRNAILEGL